MTQELHYTGRAVGMSRAPLSSILMCKHCGVKQVLPIGLLPTDQDLLRRSALGLPYYAPKTYEQWFRLEHRGCCDV